MTFSVSKFKSEGLKQGGARPSLFTVTLRSPPTLSNHINLPRSEFLVKATSLPASTVGTYDLFFHGKAIKVAGDRTFETWDTTIINDEDFGIRVALEKWMNLVSDHQLNIRSRKRIGGRQKDSSLREGESAPYKMDIFVTQFSKAGEHLHHYHFLGAFPTTLSAIPLDWGTQEIEEYTVTWTYDRWMPGGVVPHPRSDVPHLFPDETHR